MFARMADGTDSANPIVQDYLDSYQAAFDYCRPTWDQAARQLEFFVNKRFDALYSTTSQINLAYGFATVQDRMPQLINPFNLENNFSLRATNPVAELSRESAQTWLRYLTRTQLRIQDNIGVTAQSVLITGTGYRVPYITYARDEDGKYQPRIADKDVDIFSIMPAPGGGDVNPVDPEQQNAVPWIMQIDHISEAKGDALAEAGIFNKDAWGRMKSRSKQPQTTFPEDAYRNRFNIVGNFTYTGFDTWRSRLDANKQGPRARRLVYWHKRDRQVIIAEDAFLLYDGPTIFGDSTIPLVKYGMCPVGNNWFQLSYLALLEDLLKSLIMGYNYSKDSEIRALFGTQWIRQDIMDGKPPEYFMPKPYDTKSFPRAVDDIRKAIYWDRGQDAPQEVFTNESRGLALLQRIGGRPETTTSLNNVIGNKTAGGVMTIIDQLMARPNMETQEFEKNFASELSMILRIAKKFYTENQVVARDNPEDGFPWQTIMLRDIQRSYEPVMHGATFLAKQSTDFQKNIALLPYLLQQGAAGGLDTNEIMQQVVESADSLPNFKRAIRQPPPQAATPGQQGGEQSQPGGMASQQNMAQRTDNAGAGARTKGF